MSAENRDFSYPSALPYCLVQKSCSGLLFCDRMYIVVADDADDWGDSGSTRLYLTFDGENWVMYDLSLLPDTYHRVNRREKVEITFRTNGPDGLIWYSGNERDNVALYLRVC